MFTARRIALLSIACTACAGQTLEIGTNDVGAGNAGTKSAAPASCSGSLGGSMLGGDAGVAYSTDQVQAATAGCPQAHGPVTTYATVGELRSLVVGSWFLCSAAVTDTSASSVVYTADGQWYRLLADGSGGLTLGLGDSNQASWGLWCTANGQELVDPPDATPITPGACQISMRYPNGGGNNFPVALEDCPRRMQLVGDYAGFLEWYLALN